MPYGTKKPMMMKMGSKEKNTPMNFSEKAMKYMKAMPALYGKPRMDHGKSKMMKGDPPKKKYTASDSTNFMQTEARLKENIARMRRQNTGGGPITDYIDTRNLVNRQVDTLEKSPYFKTRLSRMKNPKPNMYGKPKMMVDTTKLSAPKRRLVEGVANSPKMYGKPMMDHGKPKMYKNKKKK